MQPLYQRLRELDSDTFERLAQQLLAERHPGREIKHIAGPGGDKGIDLFEGTLTERPIIWQCKHFPNGFKAIQKRQVKKSLDDAIENFKPEKWILVLSTELDTSGQEWFQQLQEDYADKTSIGLFQASDIVRELIYRRNIRDAFFPGAVLDTIAVRRSLEDLGTMDSQSLDALSKKSLDEQIARLEEADARFNYKISYGPNAGPELAKASPLGPLHVASVMEGPKRTDIFIRDLEAFRLDPPKMNFSVNLGGLKKVQEFFRTGKPQQLFAGEVTVPRSTFDFVFPDAKPKDWQLQLMPSAELAKRVLSWRVKASHTTEEVQYDLVKFQIIALGNEQVELESTSNLPFVLGLTLRAQPPMGGNFTYTERFQGFRVSAVAKALRLKYLLLRRAGIELFSLDQDVLVGTFGKGEDTTAEVPPDDRVILDMAAVASEFGWDVPYPERVGEEDLTQLAFLVLLLRGESLPISTFSGGMRKSPEMVDRVRQNANSDFEVRVCYPSVLFPPVFFGTAVKPEPVLFRSIDARIANPEDLLRRLEEAADGEEVLARFNVGEVHGYKAPAGWVQGLQFRPIEPEEKVALNAEVVATPKRSGDTD
jgi:Restriction endonuclease